MQYSVMECMYACMYACMYVCTVCTYAPPKNYDQTESKSWVQISNPTAVWTRCCRRTCGNTLLYTVGMYALLQEFLKSTFPFHVYPKLQETYVYKYASGQLDNGPLLCCCILHVLVLQHVMCQYIVIYCLCMSKCIQISKHNVFPCGESRQGHDKIKAQNERGNQKNSLMGLTA